MIKKKVPTSKKQRKRDSSKERDRVVVVHTCLPPKVDGQTRCYVRLKVTRITWLISNSPDVTHVRVHWWGEEGPGTLFRPLEVKKQSKITCQTTARYCIRSGPKQFATYLNDMGSLVFEVLTGTNQVPVGRAQIDHIAALSPSRPVTGVFPVFSADMEKVAELKISVALESLMSSYDSTSSAPTTDMSQDFYTSEPPPINMPRVIPAPAILPHTQHLTKVPSGRVTPMGVDAQLYAATPPPVSRSPAVTHKQPATAAVTNSNGYSNVDTGSQSVDLLSNLLARGSKLRDAMIISSLDTRPTVGTVRGNDDSLRSSHNSDTLGGLSRQQLKQPAVGDLHTPDFARNISRMENGVNVIDLDDDDDDDKDADDIRLLSDIDSSLDSLSLRHQLYMRSDSGDLSEVDIEDMSTQLHNVSRGSVSSLNEPGNQRPPSRRSSISSQNTPPVESTTSPRESKKPSSTGGKRPGRKARTGKRSRLRKNSKKQSESDSDTNASYHSDGSRVSFDPTPSDTERGERSKAGQIDGLSVHRLTLLGRIHMARVVVDTLALVDSDLDVAPAKERSSSGPRGKPPTPTRPRNNKRTYFVEYQFPVVATSRDKLEPSAMATEVMRVVSKKVAGSLVSFGHRSAFPVMFDAESLERWWKSALVFKVYYKSTVQKLPRLVGMCSLSLKSVLQADALFLDSTMDVKDRSTADSASSAGHDSDWPVIGQLKVAVELASDSKDFAKALAKTQLAELTSCKIVPIPQPKPKIRLNIEAKPRTGQAGSIGTQTEPVPTNIDRIPLDVPSFPQRDMIIQPNVDAVPSSFYSNAAVNEALTLHTFLGVYEGINISQQGTMTLRHSSASIPSVVPKPQSGWSGRDTNTRNLYVVCRMFWCDDICRSDVCWGTCDPQFNFTQVTPVLLTQSLLERMRNNVVVIEVWDKKTSSHEDQLVGIVKISLHQFYMSYRDRKVSAALLRSQYPVVATEQELPIMNPLSGVQYGQLKVVLAMGSMEQVANYQRARAGNASAVSVPERPHNYLERFHLTADGQPTECQSNVDNMVEHLFEVVIENIAGLKLLDNMMWGEADCFIQYHFPAQTASASHLGGATIVCGTPSLKTFRTATTLCVPDLVFNDISRHKILLTEGTPVQREILTACAGVGGGAGGIPFEIWCRYYYPNVRDQVIAKALLPLAKLCAMVTMKKPTETSIQSFSLPLTTLVSDAGDTQLDTEAASKLPITGSLSVTINYRTNIVKADRVSDTGDSLTRSLPGAIVCISVGVLKASGLQSAATVLAQSDQSMQYSAEVGVNSYIRVRLSFLQKQDERITRTVARTFAPEFSSHMDFPCPLLWTEPGSDAMSLAEILENGEAKFEIWHQVPGSSFDASRQQQKQQTANVTNNSDVVGRRLLTVSGDVLLGVVSVPLLQLLKRTTGVSGWYAVMLPSAGWDTNQKQYGEHISEVSQNVQRLERVVGGLELSVKFAHSDDRERVIHAARHVGWSPLHDIEHLDWDDADGRRYEVAIIVDSVCFPTQNALFAGQSNLDPAAACYIRYQFYDRKAVCSKSTSLCDSTERYLKSELKHRKAFSIPGTSPFKWYLTEERFEVQVWVTYQRDSSDSRPKTRDKLIGSAYIDLSSFGEVHRKQHRISGVYPLFKPGTSNLGGACINAHITLQPCSTLIATDSDSDDNVSTDVVTSQNVTSLAKRKLDSSPVEVPVDLSKTFPVHINIERAFHLPMVLDNREGIRPNCYVSYQTADRRDMTYTDIVTDTNDPVWCHENDCRLSTDLLTSDNMKFVFKVWHKPRNTTQVPDKSADKALGFVSVDLMPLTKGFAHIAGFYNIIDFNGLCQGQIKVSIVPTELFITEQNKISTQALNSSTVFLPMSIHSLSGNTVLPHFNEHFENIRRHHSELQQQQQQQIGTGDPSTTSVLFSTLRNNLKELDTMTTNLRQRLLTNREVDERAQDSESAVPLSTSSALITCGSTLLDGTWGLQSTALRSDLHAPSDPLMSTGGAADPLASTGGSATTKDAVADMMRCTLERTGSTVTDEQKFTSVNYPQYNGRSPRDRREFSTESIAGNPGEHLSNSNETRQKGRVPDDISKYTYSLQNAQALLQQLNHLTATDASKSTHNGGNSKHHSDDALVFDYNQQPESEDREMDEEEDTFANIWALRQSARHDIGSDGSDGFDSSVEQTARETSVVSPRMLNDIAADDNVEEQHRDFDGNSSDTWFVDTQDGRELDNAMASEVRRRLDASDERDSVDESTREKQRINGKPSESVSLPAAQSRSPEPPSPSTADTQTRESSSHPAGRSQTPEAVSETVLSRRSRSFRTSAMQRREQLLRDSSSDSDEQDVTSRHQRQHASPRFTPDQHPRVTESTMIPVSGLPPTASKRGNGANANINSIQQQTVSNIPSSVVQTTSAGSGSDVVGDDSDAAGRVSDKSDVPLSSADRQKPGGVVDKTPAAVASGGSDTRPLSAAASATSSNNSTFKPIRQNTAAVPNFFLPASDLERSMRMLYTGSRTQPHKSSGDVEVDTGKAAAAQELVSKLTSGKAPSLAAKTVVPQQSAEQVQRIARIFAHKFT